jgi:hypothetical protein
VGLLLCSLPGCCVGLVFQKTEGAGTGTEDLTTGEAALQCRGGGPGHKLDWDDRLHFLELPEDDELRRQLLANQLLTAHVTPEQLLPENLVIKIASVGKGSEILAHWSNVRDVANRCTCPHTMKSSRSARRRLMRHLFGARPPSPGTKVSSAKELSSLAGCKGGGGSIRITGPLRFCPRWSRWRTANPPPTPQLHSSTTSAAA